MTKKIVEKRIKRICEVCGREFTVSYRLGKKWMEKTNRGRFCSRQCYYIYRRGKRFSPKTEFKQGHQLGLNREVSLETRKKISASLKGIKIDEWKGFTNNKRQQMIHSKEYIKWRKKVFERDNYTCQNCGRRSGDGHSLYLEAHHILRVKEYPELVYDIDNGITLCRNCHNQTKKRKRKIAVIGSDGYVGSAMVRLLRSHHQIIPYDKNGRGTKAEVNKAYLAIICVPTPMKEDLSCDISIVEDVVRWLETKVILIKSTIPPGTTDYLKKKYHKRICFSPEYVGMGGYYVPEWKYPHPIKIETHTFVIVGGEEKDADFILNAFMQKLGPAKKYIKTSAINAEATKYMENSWGAMKVSFCNEWYEICKTFGANYNTVRELLLLDNRVEEMHTTVFEEKRGWSGSCYPKDICAIIRASEKSGYNPELLKSVVDNNRQVREKNNPTNWDEYDNRLNKFRFRKEK